MPKLIGLLFVQAKLDLELDGFGQDIVLEVYADHEPRVLLSVYKTSCKSWR